MTRLSIIRLRGIVLTACLAAVLAFAGQGHRAPVQQEAQLEALLLSGFAMADLCGNAGTGDMALAASCLACTPPGPVVVPAADCTFRPADLRVVAAVFAPRARLIVATVHDPARAPRAPPLA